MATTWARADRFWLRAASAGVFSLGFTTLLLSFAVEPLLPKMIGWGPSDKAAFVVAERRLADVQRKVTEARRRLGGNLPDPAALLIARDDVNHLLKRMRHARELPGLIVRRLRSLGVVLSAVGIAMILIRRRWLGGSDSVKSL